MLIVSVHIYQICLNHMYADYMQCDRGTTRQEQSINVVEQIISNVTVTELSHCYGFTRPLFQAFQRTQESTRTVQLNSEIV